jgi:spermidine synthase
MSQYNSRLRFWAYAGLFTFSGISGLIYQVVWARKLQISFGVTAFAIATVLATYFVGLALGSWMGGRISDRISRPLLVYGVIEIAVGVSVLALTPWLAQLDILLRPFQDLLEGNFWLLQASRFTITLLVLIVPTTLLGMTVPLMSRGLIADLSNIGSRVSILYAMNTLGAATGVVFAGFVLIERFGLLTTVIIASAISVLVGLLAIAIQRPVPDSSSSSPPVAAADYADKRISITILGVVMVTGAVGLSLEVVWTRVLIQNLGTTAYVFSAVLFLFLMGIGLGSIFVNRHIDRWKNLVVKLAICIAGLALITISGPYLLNRILPIIVTSMLDMIGIDQSEHFFLTWFAWSASLLLPTTILLGATFPIAARIMADSANTIGWRVGQLYSINTVGGVIGVLVTGFLLIPLAGIHLTLVLLSLCLVGLVAALAVASSKERKDVCVFTSIPVLLSITLSMIIPPDIIHSRMISATPGRVLEYKEDYYGSVVLAEERARDGDLFKRLYVNGVSYSSTGRDAMRYMRLQGHLPIALHPGSPEDILVICFGVGLTAGSASTYPDTRLTLVELSSAVLSLGDAFKDINEDVLHADTTHIVVDDGRNYLLRNSNKYFDVVTLEPPPPSHAGMANLYSREFYELVNNQLRENGVAAQWIPLHTQSHEDTKMLLATFTSVFPRASVWWTEAGETLIVGIKGDEPIDNGRFGRAFDYKKGRHSLAEVGISDEIQLAANLLLDSGGLAAYLGNSPVMTDDKPVIEYRPPGINYHYKETLREMLKYRPSALTVASFLGIEKSKIRELDYQMHVVKETYMRTRLYEQEPNY